MVHWAWIPFALSIGVIVGMFLLAWLEVTREDKKKGRENESGERR